MSESNEEKAFISPDQRHAMTIVAWQDGHHGIQVRSQRFAERPLWRCEIADCRATGNAGYDDSLGAAFDKALRAWSRALAELDRPSTVVVTSWSETPAEKEIDHE